MLRKLLSFVRANALVRPGDRIGVAVSGGADSVALLRALVEVRNELGVVLSAVHVNHGIRAEADFDAEFVAGLARQHELEIHLLQADVPSRAREKRISLEAAGREVRYDYFASLISSGLLDRIATAHTLDDQAETVLMRVLRGAGLQGLAGIHKRRPLKPSGEVVRPMLEISRAEVLAYLRGIGQEWREDASNQDVRLTRNRIRHELLPLLEQNYNPDTRRALANLADIAYADSEYLDAGTLELFEHVCDVKAREVQVERLMELPTAMQRRVLILAAAQFVGVRLEFEDCEDLRRLSTGEISGSQLDKGHRVERVRTTHGNRLRFCQPASGDSEAVDFEYALPVPGEVEAVELKSVVRARLVELSGGEQSYNPAALLDPARLRSRLTLRNFRPGDRFHPLHRKAPEKLKRLFLERKIPQEQRRKWPVLLSGEDVVWVRGFAVSEDYAVRPGSTSAVLVEEIRTDGNR